MLSKCLVGSNELWHMCFSGHILYYMSFYIAGALMHRLELLTKLQQQDALTAVMFVFGVGLCVWYHLADLGHPLLLITTYRMCIVLPLFVYFSKFMDKSIERFTTFGIHSLEIYVFHYFLLIGCSAYTASWIDAVKDMPFLFQLIFNAMTTTVIATLTLQIAKIAVNNTVVNKYFLGKLNY